MVEEDERPDHPARVEGQNPSDDETAAEIAFPFVDDAFDRHGLGVSLALKSAMRRRYRPIHGGVRTSHPGTDNAGSTEHHLSAVNLENPLRKSPADPLFRQPCAASIISAATASGCEARDAWLAARRISFLGAIREAIIS
jgi:hypothetical protein